MRRVAFLAAVLVLAVSSFAEKTKTITGQVFIRTKGGETIKLSLVEVLIFDEKTIAEHLEKKHNTAAPIDQYFRPRFERLQQILEAEKAAKERLERAEKAVSDSITGAYQLAEVKRANAYKEWKTIHDTIVIKPHDWETLRGAAGYTHSALYYFSELPKPLHFTQTDADGKFDFKIPNGSYVLCGVLSTSRWGGNRVL